MDKWRPQRDSTHQLGLGSASHEISDSSGGLSKGGEKDLSEFSRLAEFGTFLLIVPEPAVLWTNGDHSEIQHVE